MSLAENKITNLTKEINRLKEDKLELAQANVAYKNQINSRDKEIQRLTQMLHGGRPLEALNQDCCYKDVELKLVKLQDEVANLRRTNTDLESRLKDSIAKQHEAMKRALALAERNKVLEKELKDIDQMALAVEHECNSTVKTNTEKVNRLQNRLHEAIKHMQQLEKEAVDCKREKQELMSEFEGLKAEKRRLQGLLESSLEEQKRVSNRVGQFGIIENDLNLEIDRLVQLSSEQKRKIAEMECKLLSGKLDKATLKKIDEYQPTSGSAAKPTRGSPTSRSKGKATSRRYRMSSGGDNISVGPKQTDNAQTSNIEVLYNKKRFEDAATSPIKTLCPQPEQCIKRIEEFITKEIQSKNVCFEHVKEVIGKEIKELHNKANMSLEQFREERDFYKRECNSLMDKINTMYNKSDNSDLLEKLKNKEHELSNIQHECRCLLQEKQNLITRLDSAKSQSDECNPLSFRSSSKRLERERDLLRADIQHLEEERDALRHRINVLCENYNQEKTRLENMLRDREHEVKQLEQDRREIMHTQGSRRATINNLQEDCDMLSVQLKSCQSELTQQRAMYTQLKMLHEQTDRALADCQSQLIQAEKEMYMLQEKLKASEIQKEDCHKDVLNLKNDLKIMKNNLMTLDREKDSLLHTLDEKTEKLVLLEQELKSKDKKIESSETNLADLRKRISNNLSERSSQDYQIKTVTADIHKLQQELESATRARELAYEENRRLQNDLAACVRDNKRTQNDLDIARRQVDDLKRQLQHYVAEIKRAEDLISQKEIERSEMLDHYKSLSEEATNLESTNHTLETEAAQAKVQLSVALDHATDLERKVEVHDTMIRDYEKQISNLTSQIAKLESKVAQCICDKERIEAELVSMRDLCVKLDKQKDNLMVQLNEKDTTRTELTRENTGLRRNSQTLQSELDKERSNVHNLEKHLSQIRQESVDTKLLNEELRSDIQRLKVVIQDLQNKLQLCTCISMQTENRSGIHSASQTRTVDPPGKYPLKDKINGIAQKYTPSRNIDQFQTHDQTSPSLRLSELSEGELDKCFQFPSALITYKDTGRNLRKKVSLEVNNRKVSQENSLYPIPCVDSISQVNIDEEFDQALLESVKRSSDINVASCCNISKKERSNEELMMPEIISISQAPIDEEFDEQLSRRVKKPSDTNILSPCDLSVKEHASKHLKQNQAYKTVGKPRLPDIDSISEANIDDAFDEELSRRVKDLSDTNILSPYNNSKAGNIDKQPSDKNDKPNYDKPINNYSIHKYQSAFEPRTLNCNDFGRHLTTIYEGKCDQEKGRSKIPVLEKRSSRNGNNDTTNGGSRNITCTCTTPASNFHTTYSLSYKAKTQPHEEK